MKGCEYMRIVPVNCIKDGSFLARTLYDADGRILLAKGVRLTDKMLKKIEMMGYFSLYINDEYSDNEIEDIIKPELRQKAVKVLKDSFTDIVEYNEYINKSPCKVQKSYDLIMSKHRHIENLSNIVNSIVDEMLSRKNVLVNLVDIKNMDNYTYEHSVNVIILSLVVGMGLNMDKVKLYNLAMGAMLHDIGKVFVPREILLKNGKLTDEEFAVIKQHPLKGYEYLKDNTDITALSRIIILQHHEKIDGTGYPEGIKGNKMHEFAKIASIADVYDALTSDRPYRRALSPNEAIEFIMGNADRHFDFNMVNEFVRKIVPYPAGTMVNLSNGCVGVVEEVVENYPLRPRVRIVNKGNSQGGYIDLMRENNIVIQGVRYEPPF